MGGGKVGSTAALKTERVENWTKIYKKNKNRGVSSLSLSLAVSVLSLSLLSFRGYGGTTQTSEDREEEGTDRRGTLVSGGVSLFFGYNTFQRFFFLLFFFFQKLARGKISWPAALNTEERDNQGRSFKKAFFVFCFFFFF